MDNWLPADPESHKAAKRDRLTAMTRAPHSGQPRPDEVKGTFSILGPDGTPQEGVVTQWLDEFGDRVDDPSEAFQCIGYIQRGSGAGMWIRFDNDPDDWDYHRVH